MIVNPLKHGKDARRVFSFNKVFGTNVTQREGLGVIEKKGDSATYWNQICLVPHLQQMASASVVPATGLRNTSGNAISMDRLPEEMNDMKIRDDKEMETAVVDGNDTEMGHIIVTTIGGGNGQPKQVITT